MAEVVLKKPAETNLLALFLRSLLRRSSGPGEKVRQGALSIESGGMAATVRFGEVIEIERGDAPDARARVSADLPTLLAVVRGASPLLLLLKGKLRFSGSPIFLLRLLPLLRSAQTEKP